MHLLLCNKPQGRIKISSSPDRRGDNYSQAAVNINCDYTDKLTNSTNPDCGHCYSKPWLNKEGKVEQQNDPLPSNSNNIILSIVTVLQITFTQNFTSKLYKPTLNQKIPAKTLQKFFKREDLKNFCRDHWCLAAAVAQTARTSSHAERATSWGWSGRGRGGRGGGWGRWGETQGVLRDAPAVGAGTAEALQRAGPPSRHGRQGAPGRGIWRSQTVWKKSRHKIH